MSFMTKCLYFPLTKAAWVTAQPPQNASINVSAEGKLATNHGAIWFLLPLYGTPYLILLRNPLSSSDRVSAFVHPYS